MVTRTRNARPIIITDKVLKRFWEKVNKTESCWLWTGAINPSGHGVLKIQRANYGAHRISYAIAHGEIPENLFICHKCPNGDNASCVNPDHLYAGTQMQNIGDELRKRNTRHYKCENASKYRGVNYDKSRQGWQSYVYLNRKLIYIGRHVSEIDAARNHDRIKYMKYGIKTDLNFPEEYNLKE
jgi:hypothetical protein